MPTLESSLRKNMVEFIQGDLRKLTSTYNIYQNQHSILKNKIITTIFQPKIYNEDTKANRKKITE